MSNYSVGMNVRAETRQEAADREMREAINFRSKWCSKENEVSGRHERLEEKEKAKRQSRRACEARKAENLRDFWRRNICSLLLITLVCVLDICHLMEFWVCVVCMALITAYLTMNAFAYVFRNLWIPEVDGEAARFNS